MGVNRRTENNFGQARAGKKGHIFREEEVKNSLIPRSAREEGQRRLVLESFVNEIPELLCK